MTDTVVMGIIDDGIAFAHERFRTAAGQTRVQNWWLQDGVFAGPGAPAIPYGKQLNKSQINNLFGQCTHNGVINEDEVYARAGLVDFRLRRHKSVSWRAAHGTHVMDLACGYDPQEGCENRPIVAVQLATRVTADTSGYTGLLLPVLPPPIMFNPVADAIEYICACADRIAPNLPVVINLSYGVIAGPHDGTLDLEAYIDKMITDRKATVGKRQLQVILPAGNTYLSRCHACVSFATTSTVEKLTWRVQPDDRTSSFLEIWLPYRASIPNPNAPNFSRMELTITPPGGAASAPLGEEPWKVVTGRSDNGDIVALVIYRSGQHLNPAWPPSAGSFHIMLWPTARLDSTLGIAPAGDWTIELRNKSLAPAEHVDAWIQRDDSLYGFPRLGRQSYFNHPDYKRFDNAGGNIPADAMTAKVKRASTLNAIATGKLTIVAGALARKEKLRSRYSAAGPGTPSPGSAVIGHTGPDALIASDDSLVHAGVLAAGSRSGSKVAMTGTSVSAPLLARWVAKQIETTGNGDRAVVVAAADPTVPALLPPGTSPSWAEQNGAGTVPVAPLVSLKRP